MTNYIFFNKTHFCLSKALLVNGILLACLALIGFSGIAQVPPAISWEKSFGGDTADYASSIKQTTDGGYIIAGASYSQDGDLTGNNGDRDYWIVKLDANGTLSWQKSMGGSGYDVANAIQQTSDGGYIVAGVSGSNDGDVSGNHGGRDMWIIKLADNGDIDWQKSLGGSRLDEAYAIQQTTDGGYIVSGLSDSYDGDVTGNHGYDYWIVKLTANGNLSWQKCLGGSEGDWATTIQQTTDGGYIVAGYSQSIDGDVTGNHGYEDYWIVKLDTNADIEWQKSLGGSGTDWANSIQQTTDGGYIMAGYSGSYDGDITGNHGGGDYWVVKLAANGTLSWEKSLGGSGYDYSTSIQQTTDGGYIVAGVSRSINGDVTGNHGAGDFWIVKLKPNGILDWQKCLGGSNDEWASSIQQTTDGGYIVASSSNSMDGDVRENHGYVDFWIVKLGGFGVDTEEGSSAGSLSISNKEIRVWPNPAQNILTIDNNTTKDIVVLNMLGESVMTMRVVGKERIDVSTLPSGVYWLRDIDSGKGERFVKE